MPVIKSAIKKMRQDKKREKVNDEFRAKLERSVRDAKKSKNAKSVVEATSLVDRAVKNNLIHKNKAARMKSQLSKVAKPAQTKTASKPTATKATGAKKPAAKKATKAASKK